MTNEQQDLAENWAQYLTNARADGHSELAALLRAGIAASQECERAWLAAWAIQWQAQEYHWADAQAFDASEAQVSALRLMLERAAKLIDKASALMLANGKDCGGNLPIDFAEQYAAEFAAGRDALLAEIEEGL